MPTELSILPCRRDDRGMFQMSLQELIIPGLRDDHETFHMTLFEKHRSMIESMAYKYHSYHLDRAYEKWDYKQEAYLAVLEAASRWDFDRGKAQFGSLLYRYVQKQFQKRVSGKNKLVEISNTHGTIVDLMHYTVYLKRKKHLSAQGFIGTPVDRIVSLSDYTQDHGMDDIELAPLRDCERMALAL